MEYGYKQLNKTTFSDRLRSWYWTNEEDVNGVGLLALVVVGIPSAAAGWLVIGACLGGL